MRQIINYPETPDSWDKLPTEFKQYLDNLQKVKEQLAKQNYQDPIYPSCDYLWELDEDISIQTILIYWNDVEKELPDYNTILKEINDCYAENAYDEYVSSFYSY